ncbi:hypothetical protein NMY3_00309 [Candidatus Nitrosocosmicus oleophilus]|jgi:hypothetical protein|uniref:Uncharacterized protein n=1 Tax=Candidatus Nitrosocosmicus oleophilus TaxID=1353260 RepID=A0A654LW24_9ARCH|nr:hypothetical protein NMY3_00309 [Candidatus Nitrosocosmicus oleophilus]
MTGDDFLLLHFTSNENSIPTILDAVIGFNIEPYPHAPKLTVLLYGNVQA